MAAAPKMPPRFVPTLTDVVQVPGNAAPALSNAVQEQPAAPVPQVPAVPEPAASQAAPPAALDLSGALPHGIEELVVHRVMQRVDVVLDQRLREAIALVVQEQTRSMVPRLREEVESVVRHAVYEAVADELAAERSSR